MVIEYFNNSLYFKSYRHLFSKNRNLYHGTVVQNCIKSDQNRKTSCFYMFSGICRVKRLPWL